MQRGTKLQTAVWLNLLWIFCIHSLNGDALVFGRISLMEDSPASVRDTLPFAHDKEKADNIALAFKQEAAVDFNLRRFPVTIKEWQLYREALRSRIWEAAGTKVDHTLPLDYHETGVIKKQGYTIRKIYFQTRPGIYATANLYVPEGKGPFPAVINMHGHWADGKAGEMVQSCAHELALNGYVCLNIDAWGSGERATVHGVQEYHGADLGASLMNIGETLLGGQLADNIRGVDLLCSLEYVNSNRIGATGASGGGNQTMWLSAMDDRIKACMPVVSVGTFQSYVMGSNCVCELLPKGLTFTEESGVLALIAPRALKIVNGLQDRNPTFFPSEMLRSFAGAGVVYELYNKAANISYNLFDTPHGYWPEMRAQLLGWFDLHLKGKGDGTPVKETPFTLLTEQELMVFPTGQRDPLVMSIAAYSSLCGKEMTDRLEKVKVINKTEKRNALRDIVSLPADTIKAVHGFVTGDQWSGVILETVNKQLIPLTFLEAKGKEKTAVLVLFTDKDDQARRKAVLDGYKRRGYTIAVADLWGMGINASPEAKATDGSLPSFHTLSRAALWLGHSVQGEWAVEIKLLTDYIRRRFSPATVMVDASRETAVAALIQSALYANVDSCILRTCPVSYRVDDRDGIDFFNMSMHLPGILPWGDIALLTALSGCSLVEFCDPVSLSGKPVTGELLREWETGIKRAQAASGTKGRLKFISVPTAW